MTVRYYSSLAAETNLTNTITSGATVMMIDSTVGLPALTPFTMAVDYEGATEELVEVTNAAGSTLTITRAIDGTSATGHNAGARVRHVSSARDFADSRSHENSDAGVHGVAGDLVGTTDVQTISNKTIEDSTLVDVTGSLDNITINASDGTPTRINSITAADPHIVQLFDDPGSANPVFQVENSGTIVNRNRDATDDTNANLSRIYLTKSDGTTEIFVVTSAGRVTARPDSATPAFRVVPTDAVDAAGYSIRNVADSLDTIAIWNNGRMDIATQSTAFTPLTIATLVGHATSYVTVTTDGDDVLDLESTARLRANGCIDARNELNTGGNSATPLRVYPRATTGTGEQTEWHNVSGAQVARIDVLGRGAFANLEEENAAAIFTASAGWSATQIAAAKAANVVTIALELTRTGANIVATASGNIAPDVALGTVGVRYLPSDAFLNTDMSVLISNDVAAGSGILVPSTGVISIETWGPGLTISTGNIIRVTATYVGIENSIL